MATNQMEMEAKIAVADLAAIEDRLAGLGAGKTGEYTETDTFFDFPDRRLKAADSALRLRERKNLHTGQSNFRLTFKGPRQPGPFKHRREVELAVDSHENTRALLEALGLASFAEYTKRRHSWTLDGCGVEADRLEGIGQFVEVEGPDEQTIRRVMARLGLTDSPIIHKSYLSMAIKAGLAG